MGHLVVKLAVNYNKTEDVEHDPLSLVGDPADKETDVPESNPYDPEDYKADGLLFRWSNADKNCCHAIPFQ